MGFPDGLHFQSKTKPYSEVCPKFVYGEKNGSAVIFLLAALPRSNSFQARINNFSGGNMSNTRVNKLALMCAASVVALASAAHAQQVAQSGTESVTVTGSRIISDITLSPTPITAVSAEQLQQTTPTNIPDALNK